MSGTVARPPVLMKISGASSSVPFTLTARGPSKRPWPSMRVTPGVSLQPVRDALVGLPDDFVLARLDARHVDR